MVARVADERVRVANVGDAAAIAAIYAPYVTETAISFELEPPTEAEMAERIGRTLERLPWVVFEEGGEVAGYAYASRHRDRAAYQWSVDSAVYVAPRRHHRGVGRTLYATLLGTLAGLGVENVFAGITQPNEASVRLHEAMGFVAIGVYQQVGFKLGAWRDVGWWGLRLGVSSAPTRPPRAFDGILRASAKWKASE